MAAGPGLVDVAQYGTGTRKRRVCLRCAKDVTGHLVKVRAGFTCDDCSERWGAGGERKWYYLGQDERWHVSHYGISHHYQQHASNEPKLEGGRPRKSGGRGYRPRTVGRHPRWA